jgi:hypothetical protein
MTTTAAFTVKGDLQDGQDLADSILAFMGDLAVAMNYLAKSATDKGIRPTEDPDSVYPGLQQRFLRLEQLYRALTGRQPDFPEYKALTMISPAGGQFGKNLNSLIDRFPYD